MNDSLNDNDLARVSAPRPDAHGQAALLLVESLIHGLVARGVIRARDAIEIVDIAIDVKQEIAVDTGDSGDAMQRSIGILKSIGTSLLTDLDGNGSE